jgi:hypothetical protein
LVPLERAWIRAAEQDLQTQGHVNEVIPGVMVISLRKEFESIPTSDLYFIVEIARPGARPAFRAPPREAALDAANPVPLDSLYFSEGLSDPDAESFGSLLKEELQHTR